MRNQETTIESLTKDDGASPDMVEQNIEQLRAIFPEVFADGRVDFDALKQTLGEYADEQEERYSFSWHGKSQARRIAQIPSTGTLRPCPEESVDWDTTKNIFIEGDNLEVLKLLQKSYHRKIEMIYIDPPYNTGKEFIYPDKWQDNLDTYLRYTGQVDGEGLRVSANTETSGRYHTNWLNMMYPRLRLARNLLADDGVIVVHIDEHEENALGLLMDEVFGEENHLGNCVWDKRNPKGDAVGVAYQHESIVVYARNARELSNTRPIHRPKANALRMLAAAKGAVEDCDSIDDAREEYRAWVRNEGGLSGGEAMYNRLSDDGRVYRLVSMAWPNKKKAPEAYFIPLVHPTTKSACPVPDRGWRNPPETMAQLLAGGLIEFGHDHTTQPQRIYFLDENMQESVPSILPYGGSDDALFSNWGIPFDHPKPVSFAADLVTWFCPSDGVVLDFFAGSGTAGHAAWLSNASDAGGRRFILVQLPEPTDADCYSTIAEVTRARLKAAGGQLSDGGEQHPGESLTNPGDCGFRAFRLASSNVLPWDANFDTIEHDLTNAIGNIKAERSEDDVLYELLLKYGLDLSTATESRTIDGLTVTVIGAGALVACLANDITLGVVEGIAALKAELSPDVMHVVFKDTGFKDDVVKTNAAQILRQAGVDDVKTL